MKIKFVPVVVLLLLILIGCEPQQQGERILGMDIKEVPSVPYSAAYNEATSIGVREVSISLDWARLEPTVAHYDNSLPGIIDSFYPQQKADLTLILRPLDTSGPRMPADLADLSYDDPAVISAFDDFLVNLHANLSALNASGKLKWIHVGNEIDAYLGSDPIRWSQWQTFFNAAKTKIETLWGDAVEVSSVIQFSSLNDETTRDLYLDFLAGLDLSVITYYPLKSDFTMNPPATVTTDFDLLVSTIPDSDIIIQECGYPSSSVNKSSELLQANFISSVFLAWDKYMDRIKLIDFSWQYDLSEATADQWVEDYGMSDSQYATAFKHYLWTLGLNRYDSTEKAAMKQLKDELATRNWEQ
ncbi:MAG: glycosyl hydrolase 53 family protein [Candidatus Thiodiazotropha sp.]